MMPRDGKQASRSALLERPTRREGGWSEAIPKTGAWWKQGKVTVFV